MRVERAEPGGSEGADVDGRHQKSTLDLFWWRNIGGPSRICTYETRDKDG